MAKSPSKRVTQVLLAASSSPSWNEKPPWEQQDLQDEQIIVDSQISVSTKLTECPSTDVGIQLTEDVLTAQNHVKNPETVNHEEYHSCTEDHDQVQALKEPVTSTKSEGDLASETVDQHNEDKGISISQKDVGINSLRNDW